MYGQVPPKFFSLFSINVRIWPEESFAENIFPLFGVENERKQKWSLLSLRIQDKKFPSLAPEILTISNLQYI
jgi:hypothetical protein